MDSSNEATEKQTGRKGKLSLGKKADTPNKSRSQSGKAKNSPHKDAVKPGIYIFTSLD